ncbi:S8 family peptidase [Brevibacillus dissolubilis]|uniref:S8 family peptidase n=1 Tax=Brevibacillus dissolubilis TaxID=1844116 RepID=UPI001117860D|nr:S8 family serine peptidase [Brevibacillus dissolubilis]
MKSLKAVSGLALTMGLLLPLAANPVSADNGEKVRVLITSVNAEKGQSEKAGLEKEYGKRHDFGSLGFTTEVTPQQFEALQNNKNFKVERVSVQKIAEYKEEGAQSEVGTDATSDNTPWGIHAIYNDASLTSTKGGANIRVAILDTGVFTAHESLAGQAEQCKDFTQTSSSMVNNTCSDRNGHGTHVAGTALGHGANGVGVYGVAPQAKLWAYKVLSDSGSGYSDDIANAIRHAADQGAALGQKVVISMSLGSSTKDSLIASACTYAVSKGALVVAAAGNSGYNPNTIGFPGGLSDVVAVAALENVISGNTYRVANFSSRGNSTTAGDFVIQERDVEVSAPGASVHSAWYTGGYNTISGTSMATPHIAGLAAKIWATYPTWSASQVRTELQTRAKTLDVNGGYYAATGDDIAGGFGFPRVKSTDN